MNEELRKAAEDVVKEFRAHGVAYPVASAMGRLSLALAATEQSEPVAWVVESERLGPYLCHGLTEFQMKYLNRRGFKIIELSDYTHPPKGEPLSDDRIGEMAAEAWPNLPEHWWSSGNNKKSAVWLSVSNFARAIEKAVKGGE